MPPPGQLVVVPHTHWDREWYEPHEVFRLRLVHMLDRLLDTLENNPGYRFTLDGQAAAADDYVAMRPERRHRLVAAVERGQLAIGPFLILLDEFLCDGETIIRNLELGIRSSRRLGGEMRVGYLPDMFGHAAQMPQILCGFGLRHAMLWRGVPARIDRHAFGWQGLDGSMVRTEYLFDSYGNGLDLFASPDQLESLITQYQESTSGWFQSDPMLGMLGTDHSAPPADLMQTVAAANARASTSPILVDTVEGYVTKVAPTWSSGADLRLDPTVRGELRSHARGNLLPGVFSIRTKLKQAMSDAERRLGVAERLDAAFGRDDHGPFLELAWYRLIESTAHDSVTGCGTDETAAQVLGRLESAAHVARAVIVRTMGRLAASVDTDRYLVANPTAFARRALVEVELADTEQANGADAVQILRALPVVLGDERMSTAQLPALLHRIHGRELFGQLVNHYEFNPTGVRLEVAAAPVGDFDLAAFTAELGRRVSSDPGAEKQWRVEILASPRWRALAGVDLAGLTLAELDPTTATVGEHRVVVGERTMSNEKVSVSVGDQGTVRIEGADGSVITDGLQLVDEGDRGDSYNYGPVDPSTAITQTVSVDISVQEAGPLRGKLLVRRRLLVPKALDVANPDRRSAELVALDVDTVLELREREPMLRVSVTFVNTAANHRLRVLIPTGGSALAGSAAAGQYGVTERGRLGEGGWGEYPLPTYPAARFVHAGGMSLLVTKHSEYEVVSDTTSSDDVIALTLLRSVGLMSVNIHPLRDEPAGAELEVPGAQYLGASLSTEFALLPSRNGWVEAGATRWSELLRMEPEVTRGVRGEPVVVGGTADAGGAAEASELDDGGLHVRSDVVLESLRRVEGASTGKDPLEARFVNYRHNPQRLDAVTRGIWDRTDLTGRVLDFDVDLQSYVVGAARIETFRRRPGS